MADYTFTCAQLNRALYNCELPTLEEEEREDVNIWTAYSGRGMYGEKCFGTTHQLGDTVRLLMELLSGGGQTEYDEVHYELGEILNRTQTDSMGYSTIHYWPCIQITDEEQS